MSEITEYNGEYREWIKSISLRYKQCQIKAAVSVNRELVAFYWSLGREMIELEVEKKYGSRFYDRLSHDLKTEFDGLKGFSSRNLRYMSRFFSLYSIALNLPHSCLWRENMLLVVFLVITAMFIVLGIIFALGKGANLIAGYNTAPHEEKAKTDEKKLLKAMSVFMFVLAGCFLVSALSQVFHVKSLIWIGQASFAAVLIIGLIYLNTGNRFRR